MLQPDDWYHHVPNFLIKDITLDYDVTTEEAQEIVLSTLDVMFEPIIETVVDEYGILGSCACTAVVTLDTLRRGYCQDCLRNVSLQIGSPSE